MCVTSQPKTITKYCQYIWVQKLCEKEHKITFSHFSEGTINFSLWPGNKHVKF